ncbi:SusD-like starch-binding protein associating with outer membrane [Chryseobacterium sp. 52]|uniref:RagB/SusD family nutrient uptake outer membrane protein n=1 Tax=Chryseobacterium sp. 52 TaxID=2035213 RepID=UPI000C1A28CD|nr:RagB/SusD family nutrient uptake outer membrane protein [Chryseobacterium sp. 52]PIF45349.1 SusD-like starch-binding protein associating with outer membrane [Chryseobacterium sp. 52]
MKSKFLTMLFLVLWLGLGACKKQDEWLDKKANKSDVIPKTLEDFKLILNNTDIMNAWYSGYPTLSSDNFSITYANWLGAFSNSERNVYIWAKEVYEGEGSFDWTQGYQRIEFANIVLDGVSKIPVNATNQKDWNALKGTALFFRGLNYFVLAQTFAKPYDAVTADTDLGIVLRNSSDINEKITRATVKETYSQLTTDLLLAEALLPNFTSFKTQPSRIAVQGTLARVYLCMGNYERAHFYADLALKEYSTLIDFNTLNAGATAPFPVFQLDNKEIIFYATAASWSSATYAKLRVDDQLYAMYGAGDLRKSIFYVHNGTNGIAFKGNYTGTVSGGNFAGVSTNELYLIRAESAARLSKVSEAVLDINTLLKNRWDKNVAYLPFVTTDPEAALIKVIEERRKELPFMGGRRWEDLRRLNTDPRFVKTLTRVLNGTTYTLPPNDPRYIYALPDIEIRLSGLPQNIR